MTGGLPTCRLPFGVGGAVQAFFVAAAMHIEDAGLGLVHASQGIFHFDFPALVGAGHRVGRNLAQVAFRHQVLQGLGRLLLVIGVLVQHRPEGEEVIAEHALAGPQNRLLVDRHRNRDKYPDDRDHDKDLDQREAAALVTTPSKVFHRALYPGWLCTRQTRSGRPRRWTWDHPAYCAFPSPWYSSSDRGGSG